MLLEVFRSNIKIYGLGQYSNLFILIKSFFKEDDSKRMQFTTTSVINFSFMPKMCVMDVSIIRMTYSN